MDTCEDKETPTTIMEINPTDQTSTEYHGFPLTGHFGPSIPTHLERMKYEEARLNTFVSWRSTTNVNPEDLARAGFFYTNSLDRVQCAFCENVLRNWDDNDHPMFEHRRHFPRCPFVLGMDVGNRQIRPSERERIMKAFDSKKQTYQTELRNTSSLWGINKPPQQQHLNILSKLGICTQTAKHIIFATRDKRLETFTNWPYEEIQSSEKLCDAGFFSLREGDRVCCFFCDGGLCDWKIQDDPYIEHVKHYPKCQFMLQLKSEEFIKKHVNTTTSLSIEEQIINIIKKPAAQAVFDLGYSWKIVHDTLRKRLLTEGTDFYNAGELLEAVFDEEDIQSEQQSSDDLPESLLKDLNITKHSYNDEKISSSSTTSEDSEEKNTENVFKENKELKDRTKCKVCWDQEANIVFLPCQHLICCAICTPRLRNCAFCRALIQGTVRAYIS